MVLFKNKINNSKIKILKNREAHRIKVYIQDSKVIDECRQMPVFQFNEILKDDLEIFLPSQFKYVINFYDKYDNLINSKSVNPNASNSK